MEVVRIGGYGQRTDLECSLLNQDTWKLCCVLLFPVMVRSSVKMLPRPLCHPNPCGLRGWLQRLRCFQNALASSENLFIRGYASSPICQKKKRRLSIWCKRVKKIWSLFNDVISFLMNDVVSMLRWTVHHASSVKSAALILGRRGFDAIKTKLSSPNLEFCKRKIQENLSNIDSHYYVLFCDGAGGVGGALFQMVLVLTQRRKPKHLPFRMAFFLFKSRGITRAKLVSDCKSVLNIFLRGHLIRSGSSRVHNQTLKVEFLQYAP